MGHITLSISELNQIVQYLNFNLDRAFLYIQVTENYIIFKKIYEKNTINTVVKSKGPNTDKIEILFDYQYISDILNKIKEGTIKFSLDNNIVTIDVSSNIDITVEFINNLGEEFINLDAEIQSMVKIVVNKALGIENSQEILNTLVYFNQTPITPTTYLKNNVVVYKHPLIVQLFPNTENFNNWSGNKYINRLGIKIADLDKNKSGWETIYMISKIRGQINFNRVLIAFISSLFVLFIYRKKSILK